LADRQLKILIRTEIQKGFSDLAKQIESLSNQIGNLNKTFTNVAASAQKAATATAAVNKSIDDGVKLTNQLAFASTKAGVAAEKVNAAFKAGQITKKQAYEAEITLLSRIIKSEEDLNRIRGSRNSRGQFGNGGFSTASVNAVTEQFKIQNQELSRQVQLEREAASIEARRVAIQKDLTFVRKTNGGFSTGTKDYGAQFGPTSPIQSFGTNAWLDGGFGPPKPPSGGSGGGDSGGSRRNYMGPSRDSISAVESLYQSYVRLGHALFLIKYSALTIFGASGIGFIGKQVDEFITLRNQIARTSDSIEDLGDNMKAVKDIANSTFSNISSVSQIFSTIDKYSTTLGMSKEQVALVTRNISGAYAASPGSAESKSMAQYQLIQAISSNRLGGDELRSQLENAPLVAEILQKQVAKIRGKPGETINLRDSKNPVRTDELVKAFSDPETTHLIHELIGKQARTFGDILQVLHNRMVDIAGKMERFLGPAINNLALIISDDKKWDAFVDGIKTATVAVIAFATALITRGLFSTNAAGVAGIGLKGLGALKGAGSAISGGFQAAGDYAATVGRFAKLGGPGMAAGMVAGDAFSGIISGIASFLKALFSVSNVAMMVVGVIVLLVARFNELLKKFGGGVSIFDILGAMWDRLKDAMGDFADWIGNTWVGRALGAVKDFADGVLSMFGKHLIDDPRVQSRMLAREGATSVGLNSDGTRGFVTGYNSQGKLISGTVVRNGPDMGMGPTFARNEKGLIAVQTMDGKTDYLDPSGRLTSGHKAGLPPPTDTGHHKKDPWPEFIRDTKLAIDEAIQLRGQTPINQELDKAQRDIEKRAADIMDVVSFKELQKKFPAKAKEAEDLAKKMRASRLEDKYLELVDTITNALVDGFQNAFAQGLNSVQAATESIRATALRRLLDGSEFTGGKAERDAILAAAQTQSLSSLRGRIYASSTDRGISQTNRDVSHGVFSQITGMEGASNKEYNLAVKQFELQKGVDKLYGHRKELADQLAQVESKYYQMESKDPAIQEEVNRERLREIQLIKDKYDYQRSQEADFVSGIKDSITSYSDGLKDLAGEFKNTFDNVFKGLEDAFVGFIQTGKLNLGDMLRQFTADLTRTFVRQTIMKPITNFIGEKFGLNLNTDPADRIESALKIGANYVFNRIVAAFAIGSATQAASSAVSNVGSNAIAFALQVAASVMHDGGVVGMGSVHRAVNPSIFNGATRYHTGGLAGLKPDEVPAILQRGERIIPRHGKSGGSIFAPSISISYTAAPSGQNSSMTPEEHATQISTMVQSIIRKEIYDYERRSHIPGTDAYISRNVK
jgi:tape measure domain-containing protein